MNIGLYGGTFSPVHNGHVRAARLFLERYDFDKLVIMPAGVPPHKSTPESPTSEIRLEMCRAAFSDISERIAVSDFEIRKKGKSYTVDTVEYLQSMGNVTALCGADMLMSLHTWHRAAELMKKCSFAVIARENGTEGALASRIEELKERFGASIELITAEPMTVSSTQVRQMISKGQSVSCLVPEKVMKIIVDNNLYRE